jgi:integrase/recombinase XerD
VTQLRKKMLEELQRRNYSHRTTKTYVRIVREFATYFHQPPDKLGPEQIRQYQTTHISTNPTVNGSPPYG